MYQEKNLGRACDRGVCVVTSWHTFKQNCEQAMLYRFQPMLKSRESGATGALLVLALALQACTSTPPAAPPAPAAPDPVAQRIDQGLAKVSQLPDFTRGADQASKPPAAALGGAAAATVTVTYLGEAAVMLRSVATARGKQFRVTGPKPHLPLMVQVRAVNVPYEEFLKDLGLQFGQRADLVLSDGHIEIRYRGVP
jgi:defect-in-organelle-trafficking protein DotD